MLEEDASNLLEYMIANGLIANAGKPAFVLLNAKKDTKVQLKIGTAIVENQKNAKLLGMRFENSMMWHEHIHGKGGVVKNSVH